MKASKLINETLENRSESEVNYIRLSSRVHCSCGHPKCVIGLGFQGEVLRFVDQQGKESAMYLDPSKTVEIFDDLIEYTEVKEHMITTMLNMRNKEIESDILKHIESDLYAILIRCRCLKSARVLMKEGIITSESDPSVQIAGWIEYFKKLHNQWNYLRLILFQLNTSL